MFIYIITNHIYGGIMNFLIKNWAKTMFLIFFGILTWWLFSNIKPRNIFVILKHALSIL